MFYRGSAGDGAVADRQRRAERGHAIDRRVLDAGVRSAGAAWFGSISGECRAHEEPAGAQKRCAGVSMAAEIARLRTVEQQLSAYQRNPDRAHVVAAKR